MTVDEAKQIMMNTPIQVVRTEATIKVSKEYPSGLTTGKWYSIELPITDKDNCIEELLTLERKLDEAFRLSQSYPNGKEAVVDSHDGERINSLLSDEAGQWAKPHEGLRFMASKEKVINRQDEREYIKVEKEIATVTSLEELSKYKEYCGKNPDLMSAYMTKMKSLTQNIKV
jgi:hypothetical protein